MFCPSCGKNTKELIDGKCINCYIKDILSKMNNLEIKICSNCKSLILKNRKISTSDLKEHIEKLLNTEICLNNISINESLNNITINFSISNIDKELTHNLNPAKVICNRCKEHPRKKRIIIQFRGDPSKILKFLEMLINEHRIVDVVEKREGIDVYLDETLISLRNYIKKLRKECKEIKLTRKLVGFDRQRSRKIYRLKILLRF